MISFEVKGDSNKTEKFLKKTYLFLHNAQYLPFLNKAGREGIAALREHTPKDTGLTAESWDYEISFDQDGVSVSWSNSNVVNDWFNVALALQFGHGTRNGGYVEGIDYINPALKPIFDDIANELWEEVTSN